MTTHKLINAVTPHKLTVLKKERKKMHLYVCVCILPYGLQNGAVEKVLLLNEYIYTLHLVIHIYICM